MSSSGSRIVNVRTSKKRRNSSSPLRAQQRGRVVDRPDPSTSQRGTPPQTRLAKIPDQAIERMSISLGRCIFPEDDDNLVRDSLGLVWKVVQEVFKHDPTLKEHQAEEDEFLDNVKHKGEQIFFNSLRDMAKHRSWEPLFDDGTLFSSFDSKHSDHVLFLDVFSKPKRTQPVKSKIKLDPALKSGAQCYQSLSTFL
jgi:hypothetical protein